MLTYYVCIVLSVRYFDLQEAACQDLEEMEVEDDSETESEEESEEDSEAALEAEAQRRLQRSLFEKDKVYSHLKDVHFHVVCAYRWTIKQVN